MRIAVTMTLWIVVLVLSGFGCHSGNPRTRSLASKPPSAFPRSATHTEIAADLETHLVDVVSAAPDARVLAYILFQSITWPALDGLISMYQLRSGPEAAVELVGPGEIPAHYYEPLPLKSLSSAGIVANHQQLRGLPSSESSSDLFGDLRVVSFTVWSTPDNLLQLWNENRTLVQAIAILGTPDDLHFTWGGISPGAALR